MMTAFGKTGRKRKGRFGVCDGDKLTFVYRNCWWWAAPLYGRSRHCHDTN